MAQCRNTQDGNVYELVKAESRAIATGIYRKKVAIKANLYYAVDSQGKYATIGEYFPTEQWEEVATTTAQSEPTAVEESVVEEEVKEETSTETTTTPKTSVAKTKPKVKSKASKSKTSKK